VLSLIVSAASPPPFLAFRTKFASLLTNCIKIKQLKMGHVAQTRSGDFSMAQSKEILMAATKLKLMWACRFRHLPRASGSKCGGIVCSYPCRPSAHCRLLRTAGPVAVLARSPTRLDTAVTRRCT
jgi:hypothetical protein